MGAVRAARAKLGYGYGHGGGYGDGREGGHGRVQTDCRYQAQLRSPSAINEMREGPLTLLSIEVANL